MNNEYILNVMPLLIVVFVFSDYNIALFTNQLVIYLLIKIIKNATFICFNIGFALGYNISSKTLDGECKGVT